MVKKLDAIKNEIAESDNTDFMLETYFDTKILCLIEKMLGSLSVSVEMRILQALKFSGRKFMTLQHYVFQLRPSCMEVSNSHEFRAKALSVRFLCHFAT